jgi:uncharacterized membrane protein YccC
MSFELGTQRKNVKRGELYFCTQTLLHEFLTSSLDLELVVRRGEWRLLLAIIRRFLHLRICELLYPGIGEVRLDEKMYVA